MIRIDLLLTHRQLAKSRAQAQHFIQSSRVFVRQTDKWLLVEKPSQKVAEDAELRISASDDDRYVSRGALKLEGALNDTQLDIRNFTVLDIGQSTGGFTDCALQFGAKKVVGIEVGHDQLAQRLRTDTRVVCFEGINARHLEASQIGEHFPAQGFDLIVMDVSFISQTKVLPQLPALLSKDGHLISLVKPQFEVGKEAISKGGLVKDQEKIQQLESQICAFVRQLGLKVNMYIESPITGGDGNKEFLLWATR